MGIEKTKWADKMAKEGTKDYRDNRVKVPLSDWNRIFKEEMEQRTKKFCVNRW